jgi:hypothetical protein
MLTTTTLEKMSSQSIEAQDLKECTKNGCQTQFPATLGYDRCEACRTKDRDRKRRARAQKNKENISSDVSPALHKPPVPLPDMRAPLGPSTMNVEQANSDIPNEDGPDIKREKRRKVS